MLSKHETGLPALLTVNTEIVAPYARLPLFGRGQTRPLALACG